MRPFSILLCSGFSNTAAICYTARMLRRIILSFTFALLFTLGQQGAAIHEISHYADLTPASDQQDQAPHSPVCDKCLSYGELAHALGVQDFSLPLPAASFEAAVYTGSSHFSASLRPYSARAPPQSA